MLRRARSMALEMADGTSRALPYPRPTRPSPSPTTVSAVKVICRPPLTVLATRLTDISFSSRPSEFSRSLEGMWFPVLPGNTPGLLLAAQRPLGVVVDLVGAGLPATIRHRAEPSRAGALLH